MKASDAYRVFIWMGVQLLLLDYMIVGTVLHPWLYALPLAIMPLRMNRSLMLLLAFFMGLTYDVLTHSYGPHTMALPLLVLVRPLLVGLFTFRGGDEMDRMSMHELGIVKFFMYLLLFSWVHQWAVLSLDYFTIAGIFKALLRGLGGALYSVILYLALHLIFQRSVR